MLLAFGCVVADAMRWKVSADAAIINGGFLRGGRVYQPENVNARELLNGVNVESIPEDPACFQFKRSDIERECPFMCKTVVLAIQGKDLQDTLEQQLALPKPSGAFPHVSGMRIVFSDSKPKHKRISSVDMLLPNGEWEPLDAKATYSLAVSDFMAAGGDGVTALKRAAVVSVPDLPLVRDAVVDYLKYNKFLMLKLEGRLMNEKI